MVADNIFRIVLNFLHEIYYTVWVLLLAPIRRQSGFVPESRIFCFVPHKIYLRSWRFITGGLWSKSLNILLSASWRITKSLAFLDGLGGICPRVTKYFFSLHSKNIKCSSARLSALSCFGTRASARSNPSRRDKQQQPESFRFQAG